MSAIEKTNFHRIEAAIGYISANFKTQPDLDEVARSIHLSPYHFQRLFSDWAGISPKKFLQYISIEHAKHLLKEGIPSLADTAFETGLSGTSRLHDLFITIEGMTPGEYKNGGENLTINYEFAATPFGNILAASTPIGICHMGFADDLPAALKSLRDRFPRATLQQRTDAHQTNALKIFRHDWKKLQEIKLHLRGTDFQIKIWEALLKIPRGRLATYGAVAQYIKSPKASRAVGSAIGSNPVAFLIPCHRVIQSTGGIGQYHWGANRKAAMIGWEAADNP